MRDGPRERLHRLGPRALSDVELLALVLGGGAARASALTLARRLLDELGDLSAVAKSEAAALARLSGLGPARSASVAAAGEIGRRVSTRRLEPGARIEGPADVHAHFYEWLRGCETERFHTLLLDGRHRVSGDVLVSQGTLTASLVHPREVFRPAVRRAAAAIVLVHNHPSGDPAPSAEDRRVTERLVRVGEMLGIRVLDHVVVAERGYYSFRDAGEL